VLHCSRCSRPTRHEHPPTTHYSAFPPQHACESRAIHVIGAITRTLVSGGARFPVCFSITRSTRSHVDIHGHGQVRRGGQRTSGTALPYTPCFFFGFFIHFFLKRNGLICFFHLRAESGNVISRSDGIRERVWKLSGSGETVSTSGLGILCMLLEINSLR
jgi:hypothetical protein